jgi:hypothetical protein
MNRLVEREIGLDKSVTFVSVAVDEVADLVERGRVFDSTRGVEWKVAGEKNVG